MLSPGPGIDSGFNPDRGTNNNTILAGLVRGEVAPLNRSFTHIIVYGLGPIIAGL